MKFTKVQLNNWRVYERVRSSGRWNMYSPQAFSATCLTAVAYNFVVDNFSALKIAVEKDDRS